mgnify:CR=1 FL=1
MRIFDRYTGLTINDSKLPNLIELGRYAILENNKIIELSNRTFKVKEGQRINQDLLEPVYKDTHDIFESIATCVDSGDFSAIPLIQGFKYGLDFGAFAQALEEKIYHLKAIFQDPYTKLNRTIEKVPVSRAKRISNRSNEYLAAHTEDWLNKSLIGFHPSRILTEETIVDENVYENQLLIAFTTRASQYLERRYKHTSFVASFLEDYDNIMKKYASGIGWYKLNKRELDLAGKVYYEESGNYKSATSDLETIGQTRKRLKKLRDNLLRFRKYDLYYTVNSKNTYTIQYHDTNVLVNHKHYRFLKELWFLLIKEEISEDKKDDFFIEDFIIENVRKYGLSIVNYIFRNKEYFSYNMAENGTDIKWSGKIENWPRVELEYDKYGIINLKIGNENIKFVVVCNIPDLNKLPEIPEHTFILAYNNENEIVNNNKNVISISLKDITCVERVAYVIKKIIFKQYLQNTIFKYFDIPKMLFTYKDVISSQFRCIEIVENSGKYRFIKYPELISQRKQIIELIKNHNSNKEKNSKDLKIIEETIKSFLDKYEDAVNEISNNLSCFDIDCCQPIEKWHCENLNYIQCPHCGYIIDSTGASSVKFVNKSFEVSEKEMGMDYLEVDCTDMLYK